MFDSNAYGIALAKNLVDFDAAFVTWMDDAQIFPLLVPLCENEVLVLSIAELQVKRKPRFEFRGNSRSFFLSPFRSALLEDCVKRQTLPCRSIRIQNIFSFLSGSGIA